MGSIKTLFLLALSVFVLSGCSPEITVEQTPLPCDQELSWDQAIEILNTGKVETVMQTHSLKVSFRLENGCRITSVEPRIDDIIAELDRCGDPCEGIVFATE